MSEYLEPFNYNGDKIPKGGRPGEVLVKIAGANFYDAWRSMTSVFEYYDVVFDEGEYQNIKVIPSTRS